MRKKLEDPEETHTDMGRTRQLYTDSSPAQEAIFFSYQRSNKTKLNDVIQGPAILTTAMTAVEKHKKLWKKSHLDFKVKTGLWQKVILK